MRLTMRITCMVGLLLSFACQNSTASQTLEDAATTIDLDAAFASVAGTDAASVAARKSFSTRKIMDLYRDLLVKTDDAPVHFTVGTVHNLHGSLLKGREAIDKLAAKYSTIGALKAAYGIDPEAAPERSEFFEAFRDAVAAEHGPGAGLQLDSLSDPVACQPGEPNCFHVFVKALSGIKQDYYETSGGRSQGELTRAEAKQWATSLGGVLVHTELQDGPSVPLMTNHGMINGVLPQVANANACPKGQKPVEQGSNQVLTGCAASDSQAP